MEEVGVMVRCLCSDRDWELKYKIGEVFAFMFIAMVNY